MRKFMFALLLAAGVGSVGVAVAASFSPAEAACHNYRTSRFHTGVC